MSTNTVELIEQCATECVADLEVCQFSTNVPHLAALEYIFQIDAYSMKNKKKGDLIENFRGAHVGYAERQEARLSRRSQRRHPWEIAKATLP